MSPDPPGHYRAAAVAILATGAAVAADDLESLVGKLSSEEFKARESASAELVRRGRDDTAAVQAVCLRSYLTSKDPEIRIRSKEILRQLLSRSYGFLGVRHRASEFFDEAGETRKGVEIMAVEDGHAARAAAMKVGDIVIALDGKAFDDAEPAEDFGRRIRLLGAGRKITLKVERAGQTITIPLVTGAAPENIAGLDSEARFQEWLKAQAEGQKPE